MEQILLLSAGVTMAAITALHILAGGRTIADPLAQHSGLWDDVRETMLYCWHAVSWVLAASTAGYFLAWWTGTIEWAVSAGAVAVGFALIGLAWPLRRPVGYRVLPQGWLFVPVVLMTGWALL